MKNPKRFQSLPICLVFTLMGLIYYSTVFIFIKDWLRLNTAHGILNSFFFTCFAFMSFSSFVASILIDPGNVPSTYVPEIEEAQVSSQHIPNKNGVKSIYCDKCSTYKPPRAHHCRVCRRCVLRMDHHCVWINNCVGYANYKPFMNFVFYAAVGCIYSTAMVITHATQKDFTGKIALKIFYVLSGSLMVSLSSTVGILLGWHIYLLTHNMTTIEYHGVKRAMWLAKKSGQSYNHPFNIGVLRNLTMMLGPNVPKWLCPIAVGHLKDGIQFPTSHDSS